MSNEGEPLRHVDRAAQFVPFAALTGYYDLIRERASLTLTSEPDVMMTARPDASAMAGANAMANPGGSARRSPQARPWPHEERPCEGGTQCGSDRAPAS